MQATHRGSALSNRTVPVRPSNNRASSSRIVTLSRAAQQQTAETEQSVCATGDGVPRMVYPRQTPKYLCNILLVKLNFKIESALVLMLRLTQCTAQTSLRCIRTHETLYPMLGCGIECSDVDVDTHCMATAVALAYTVFLSVFFVFRVKFPALRASRAMSTPLSRDKFHYVHTRTC